MSVELRIVTPKAVAWTGTADEVLAPGHHGQFGVLPGHERFLSVARPGRVVIRSGESEQIFVVGTGFIEVGAEHVTILTDVCEPLAEVDPEQAARDLAEAEVELGHSVQGTAGWDEAEKRADLARARIG
jgi:F-type H+-transporting ATPase subunit epsilon